MKTSTRLMAFFRCVSLIHNNVYGKNASEDLSYIKSSDGILLAVKENGNPQGKQILFIHGFSQSHISWKYQINSNLAQDFRLVVFDLRGHGFSEKPDDDVSVQYHPDTWADDINAVVTKLGLRKPLMVAWSYGGEVVLDYLAKYGDENVSGLVMVAAGTGKAAELGHFGPVMEKNFFDLHALKPPEGDKPPASGQDSYEAQYRGSVNFVKEMTAKPLTLEDQWQMISYNLMTPVFVRRTIPARADVSPDSPRKHVEAMQKLSIPVLAIHGDKDRVVLPASSDFIVKTIPNAKKKIYSGIGHAPFLEAPEIFNKDLRAFVDWIQK